MMVDAVIGAMAVAGQENIPVIVTETGWPSSATDSSKVEANKGYAKMYLKGLVWHLNSGLGTPLRKEGVAEIYIYELFDEDGENGTQRNRNWGIIYPNFTNKYNIDFSGSVMIGLDTTLFEMACWLFIGPCSNVVSIAKLVDCCLLLPSSQGSHFQGFSGSS